MNKNILIMEDDPFTQEFYRFLFQRKGYNFVITDDGDKFVNSLENDEVSIIILDINLKNTFLNNQKVDGLFFASYIKKNNKYKDIPIIVVTAYQNNINGKDLVKDCLADDFIIKPIIDFNDLIKKIEKFTHNNGN
jgi:CheY-like chemotaxis protein